MLGLSLVTNLAAGLSGEQLDHDEVSGRHGPRRSGWGQLLAQFVARL